MDEKTRYWVEIADYDLETAKAMLKTGRYLYVGFMCQQIIEKTLKAVISKNGDFPPKIHRLRKLAELAGLYDQMNEVQQHHLNILEPLSIEARYPDERSRIGAELNAARCRSILEETQELHKWIKAML